MNKQRSSTRINDFGALKLTLASPEQILDWSYGEVTKAETINYRTFKPEPDGLFCEKIFGPTKNFECYCGKYRKVRYKGIVCDKCGVEVTTKDVRRERMGHINLVVPVMHVWFAYGVPNKLSIVLNMSHKKLLSVIYYTRYMVIDVQDERREEMLSKVADIMNADKASIEKDMNSEIDELEKAFKKEVEDMKKAKKDKGALDFQLNKLEHDHNLEIAKVKHEYVQMMADREQYFSKISETVRNVAIGSILTEDEYIDLEDNDLLFFDAKMGAEAIEAMLKKLNIENEIALLRRLSLNEKSTEKKLVLIKRLQYLEGFTVNKLDPTWMVLHVIPVLPPELRPIIPLSGGKFATNDLNDLYRRIINRNNRLARLIEIGAPEVILRNEKRMLQESVDALIDNQHRPGKPMLNGKKLPYSSLTDQLRGKKGIFRKNLLGKRVDYSGRAVIVGDATLLLHQCGLPKSVALEIFKPFVIQKLLLREDAPNIKVAKDMIDEKGDMIWDILEEIIKDKPVLLNRAPTLHKYSIQAFYPKLVEGEAIRIHPLICKAFNADFDGDQMAVHVLLTEEAVQEGIAKMMATKNIISIANGKILAGPSKDMDLGFYLMTDMDEQKNPKVFGCFNDAIKAYYRGNITATEEIITRGKGQTLHTSVGRIIFNNVLPEDYPYINRQLNGIDVNTLVEDIKDKYSLEVTVQILDVLKAIGFKFATDMAFTFGMEDCKLNIDIHSRIQELEQKDLQLQENYLQGLITQEEKKRISVQQWNDFADTLSDEAWKSLDKSNPVFQMVESKANGARIQGRQVMTIKGMTRDSQGNWVPMPIKGNYRDGLNAFEYFISSSGGRKGVADTALRTPSSGYLTRKLVDVAHDSIVRQEDCGYSGEGIVVRKNDERRLNFTDRLYGRTVTKDVLDKKGKVIVKAQDSITKDIARKIDEAGVEEVYVRSAINCQCPIGMCRKCYGFDIEAGNLVDMGKAVGVIAAQSIGEPATQFTLSTFHSGGVQKTDMTQGLPRVEELFEARAPKAQAYIAKFDGVAKVEKLEDESTVIHIEGEKNVERYYILAGAKKVNVEDGAKVKVGDILFIDGEEKERQSQYTGNVHIDHGVMKIEGTMKAEETITVQPGVDVLINDGDKVEAGKQLTIGAIDPKELSEVAGIEKAQKYVIDECQKVFNEQGVALSDVHFEVIVRQMARLGRVMDSGDSTYLVGSLVNKFIAEVKNVKLREQDKNIVLVLPKLLGIKASALYTESLLSAMSFQEQVRVLTNYAILGKVDYLRGMKENVMIGKKIPYGETAEIKDIYGLEEVEE